MLSSFLIVPTAVDRLMTPFLILVSLTVKVSSGSTRSSPLMATVIFLVCFFAGPLKTSFPDAAA